MRTMDKKYDHQAAEQAAQQLWAQGNVYAAEHNKGPLYSIDTPPPTVSGSLHIGHIFSYTQTDIIARYKRMSGFSVFYPFGFDDNGLPTERFVEKKLNVVGHSMPRSAFIELCLQETIAVEKQFEELWKRIGLSVDWSKSYSTIDRRSRLISQRSFIELYKKGYVYRKDEPALYCTACRTSVAQAELDDKEVPSIFNTFLFATIEGKELLVATTRPELLSSCVALLYNPSDERYAFLKDKKVTVPLFGHEVPVLADEQVSIEKGTGLVMCCTFGDKTDIEWYKKFALPYRPSIGHDGRWLPTTGILAGLKVKQAREAMINALREHGLLREQKQIVHAVNVHERCKNEIEYIVLKQWFLKLIDFKEQLLQAAEELNWYPHFMKARYRNWVENISWDWCISRQRFYGIPFPVWHCTDCGHVIVPHDNQLPLDPQETSYTGTCSECHGAHIVPDTDVMDTWNTSSLTPYICASLYHNSDDVLLQKTESFLPMSMRPQAHDIIRTWAFYTMVKTWMHHGVLPWKNIVISGHVLSTEKEKISKSQGNSPLQPENLLKAYPADVIRYWTAASTLGQDTPFSENQLKIGQRLLVKMWNLFLFVIEHGKKYYDPLAPQELLNQWILHRATETFAQYQKYFAEHEFGLALASAEKFFYHDFCDNYIELIKDQFFNPEQYSHAQVAETRYVLYEVGLRILQFFAPIMPHVTETIYGYIYKAEMGTISLHQTHFPQVHQEYIFSKAVDEMNIILHLVNQMRKLKSDHKISLKTEIAEMIISADQKKLDTVHKHEKILKGIAHAQMITYTTELLDTMLEQRDGRWFAQLNGELG